MKQKINRWWTWMLGGLLGLLGFAGCKGVDPDPWSQGLLMYGPPPGEYKILEYKFVGEATDAAGKGIEGIRVVFAPFGLSSPEGKEVNDTLYTGSSGKIEKVYKTPAQFLVCSATEVEFADVDGAANGEYETSVLKRKEIQIIDSSSPSELVTVKAKAQMKAKE